MGGGGSTRGVSTLGVERSDTDTRGSAGVRGRGGKGVAPFLSVDVEKGPAKVTPTAHSGGSKTTRGLIIRGKAHVRFQRRAL